MTQQTIKAERSIALIIQHSIAADYQWGTQSFHYGFVTVPTDESATLQVRNPSELSMDATSQATWICNSPVRLPAI